MRRVFLSPSTEEAEEAGRSPDGAGSDNNRRRRPTPRAGPTPGGRGVPPPPIPPDLAPSLVVVLLRLQFSAEESRSQLAALRNGPGKDELPRELGGAVTSPVLGSVNELEGVLSVRACPLAGDSGVDVLSFPGFRVYCTIRLDLKWLRGYTPSQLLPVVGPTSRQPPGFRRSFRLRAKRPTPRRRNGSGEWHRVVVSHHGDSKRTALRDVGGCPCGGERRSRWEGFVRSLSS